jgi:hypothetical protein
VSVPSPAATGRPRLHRRAARRLTAPCVFRWRDQRRALPRLCRAGAGADAARR